MRDAEEILQDPESSDVKVIDALKQLFRIPMGSDYKSSEKSRILGNYVSDLATRVTALLEKNKYDEAKALLTPWRTALDGRTNSLLDAIDRQIADADEVKSGIKPG